jgi:hypothetical protein
VLLLAAGRKGLEIVHILFMAQGREMDLLGKLRRIKIGIPTSKEAKKTKIEVKFK